MPDTNVVVVGRIPPPIDGQSLLTERVAKILGDAFTTKVVNTNTDRGKLSKIRHYQRIGEEIGSTVRDTPNAVVVWPSISPHPVSHFRDMYTVVRRCGSSPIVAVVHWGNFDRLFSSRITKSSAKGIVKRVNRFVFLDTTLANACSRWIPDHKIVTINNPLDSEVITSRSDVLDRISAGPSSPFRILYLSNMIRSKGYMDVLEAAKILVESGHSIYAEFVGAWHEDRAAFEDFITKHHLQDHVVHHGPVSDRQAIRQFLLRADAFVLPTYYPTEAQPSSLIEALSAATPVITTDQGGITEMVVPGRDAIIVPKQSPEKIAKAVEELMGEETWRQFALNARRRFETHFDIDTITRQWFELIRQVARENG